MGPHPSNPISLRRRGRGVRPQLQFISSRNLN
nr:MAG TPA: hypothetical protein [Caudoviricetes sp.]